jgi:hypothetical protein
MTPFLFFILIFIESYHFYDTFYGPLIVFIAFCTLTFTFYFMSLFQYIIPDVTAIQELKLFFLKSLVFLSEKK